jgi:hypothetical protein
MTELTFEEPNWRGHEPADSEHDFRANVASLMANCDVRITRIELLAPFACNPEQKYVAGCIYLNNRGWNIEGREHLGHFNIAETALNTLTEWIEIERTAQFQKEFRESGI